MPTTVSKVIATDGSGDFTSLAAWKAGCPANLVTSDQIWDGQCKNVAEFTSATTLLTLSGITVDATRYVQLRCQSGQSFKDNASVRSNALAYNQSNGVGIRCSGGYAIAIQDNIGNTHYNGLQVKSGDSSIAQGGGTLGLTVSNCILQSVTSGKDNCVFTIGIATVTNTLVICNGGTAIGLGRSGGTGSSLIGCTVINAGTGDCINADNYGTHIIIDTAGFGGSGSFVVTTSSSGSSSNNSTDRSSGFGAANQTSLTFANQVVSTTTDFRAKVGSSLANNGATNSNILTDISGTTRGLSNVTIGCWELTASVVADTFPTYSHPSYVFEEEFEEILY